MEIDKRTLAIAVDSEEARGDFKQFEVSIDKVCKTIQRMTRCIDQGMESVNGASKKMRAASEHVSHLARSFDQVCAAVERMKKCVKDGMKDLDGAFGATRDSLSTFKEFILAVFAIILGRRLDKGIDFISKKLRGFRGDLSRLKAPLVKFGESISRLKGPLGKLKGFIGRFLPSLTRLGAGFTAMRGMIALAGPALISLGAMLLAFAATPVGAAVVGVGLLAGGLVYLATRETDAEKAAKSHGEALDLVKQRTEEAKTASAGRALELQKETQAEIKAADERVRVADKAFKAAELAAKTPAGPYRSVGNHMELSDALKALEVEKKRLSDLQTAQAELTKVIEKNAAAGATGELATAAEGAGNALIIVGEAAGATGEAVTTAMGEAAEETEALRDRIDGIWEDTGTQIENTLTGALRDALRGESGYCAANNNATPLALAA